MQIKTIRNKSDINKVIDLFIKVFAEPPYKEIWTKDLVLKRLLETYSSGQDFCFCMENKREVIGFIFCSTQTWYDGLHVIIEDVVVDQQYRGRGIGRKLVKKLEQVAKEKKVASIDLFSYTKSKAVKFWQKQKYKPNGYIEMNKKLT